MSIKSSTYIRSLFTNLLTNSSVIIDDIDSPRFRKYAEQCNTHISKIPHRTEYSSKQHRKIVVQWIYFI